MFDLSCDCYFLLVQLSGLYSARCTESGQPPTTVQCHGKHATPTLGRQRGFFLRQNKAVTTLRSISTCCARVLTYPHRRLHPPTERFAVRHYASSLGPTALSKWSRRGSRQSRYVYAGWYQDRFFGLFFYDQWLGFLTGANASFKLISFFSDFKFPLNDPTITWAPLQSPLTKQVT